MSSNKNIGFKRGGSPKESLSIGGYREIPVPLSMAISDVPPGTYLISSKDNTCKLLQFSGTKDIQDLTFWQDAERFYEDQKFTDKIAIVRLPDPIKWFDDHNVYKIQKYSRKI